MENDRDADSPGTYQKKLESVRSVLWDMCSILSSKIEQGKMEVSEEILKLLLERLELLWIDDKETKDLEVLWKHSMNFYLRILYKNF